MALPAGAQTGLSSIGVGRGGSRPGGVIQGGPGRVASPAPARPPVAPSVIRPGIPDARLGAGGVRPNTGNIVYPGTPNGRGVGNILTPGTPAVQPIPSIVQPARPSVQEIGPQDGRHRGRGGRFGAGAYPVYGFYPYALVPNVIAVTGSTIARSSTGYVITVGDDTGADTEEPASPPAERIETDYWLIALQGGLIYAVSDYGVEGRAFRFLTLQGDRYVVPLAELDVDFTMKLNRDRGVEIELE
jgi:hypothetical protein